MADQHHTKRCPPRCLLETSCGCDDFWHSSPVWQGGQWPKTISSRDESTRYTNWVQSKRRGSEKSTCLSPFFWRSLIFSGAPVLWEFQYRTFRFYRITTFTYHWAKLHYKLNSHGILNCSPVIHYKIFKFAKHFFLCSCFLLIFFGNYFQAGWEEWPIRREAKLHNQTIKFPKLIPEKYRLVTTL